MIKQYHICLCCDENYLRHCAVTMLSVLGSCAGNERSFQFHLLVGSTLSPDGNSKLMQFVHDHSIDLEIHLVDETRLGDVKFREARPLSKAAYYRLLLSSILPENIHTVLYLDSDLLVLRDISDLFKLDISHYALAATKDISGFDDEHRFQLELSYTQPYFCSGMMYVNLDYWRENRVENLLLEFARRERKVYYHDQDALNYVFKGRWFRLSPAWNRFYPFFYSDRMFEDDGGRYEMEHNPRIVHFFHYFKPWNHFRITGREWNTYRKIYADYLAATPWAGTPQDLRYQDDKESKEMYRQYRWKSFFHKLNMLGFYQNLNALYFKLGHLFNQ